ncbi:MAG: hypothetical protein JSR82_11575 [Verrucomicrobia bacterium]|nr:hypothetical protein [Verrucomicrobiota bacterium]
MTTLERQFLHAVEVHSPDELRESLRAGLDVSAPVAGKPATAWLTEMYLRSDRFPDCLRVLLEAGAPLADSRLMPVLLDDGEAVRAAVARDRSLLTARVELTSAFTPLREATLLHVAAEFGHARAAQALLEAGAEVDATAGIDAWGRGGHTPLFHTVNSNANRSAGLMRLLLEAGARTDHRVAALTWGDGFDWETTFFDLTPISYAQLGCLPQMQRSEKDMVDNISTLLRAAGRAVPPLDNVPNRYLRS